MHTNEEKVRANRNRKKIVPLIYGIVIGAILSFFLCNDCGDNWKSVAMMISMSTLYSYAFWFGIPQIYLFLDKRYSWLEEPIKKSSLSFLLITIYAYFISYTVNILFNLYYNPHNLEYSVDITNYKNHVITIIVVLIVSFFMTTRGFFYEWKMQVEKEKKLIKENAQARYEVLKNQVDPHFLFNSLNVLSSLIDENPEKSQEFLSKLSKLYRRSLEYKNDELNTVENELEIVKDYIYLQNIRFEKAVETTISIPDNLLKKHLLPMSLQMLVENIFKHNKAENKNPLKIDIKNNSNYIIVSNNIISKTVLNSNKKGLLNITERYKLLTDKKVIVENTELYFKVSLPILDIK